ncbi:hypothetical protein C8R44DRAFT_982292 [Mycena epipterygia]|nr:hypothetical protein C8R44DRAFT_982292 [Mycena epipterygia]
MSGSGFPWNVFSANTLRPMMVDVLRSAGRSNMRLNKEESIALLQKIEKHGLEAAFRDYPAGTNASASSSKRKHEEPNEEEREASSEPTRKRGRPRKGLGPATASAPVTSASRTRGRISDPGPALDAGQGLLTRRQAAQARGENVPPTRSWKSATRSPRKSAQKASEAADASASAPPKPKSKGQVFDAVVIVKRPNSYVGKGKDRETVEMAKDEVDEQDGASDADAEGEIVEDGIEMETSSLENSNKENDMTLLEIANADTDNEVDADTGADEDAGAGADADADAEGDIIPVEEIGSPAPQITIERTDDQIEEARNNDVTIEIGSPAPEITIPAEEIGSPAPEITIEPMADDGAMEELEENGYSEHGGLLRPRIDIPRAGSLNPEYSIEVFSPTSEQHDSDDEMWIAGGINLNGNNEGLRVAGGGLGPLDALAGSGLGPLDALD